MSTFKLVTDKKPAGGQPEAIKKLVEGYGKHKRQTLLGITGSGKSLASHEPILIRTKKGRLVRTTIGEFVDTKLTAPSILGETLYQATEGYKVLSFDPHTGETKEREITQVSKHAEQVVYEVVLDDNSSIQVTADHNCFRFKNGSFDLCETRELTVGDYLPLAMYAPAPIHPITQVNITQYNRAAKIITVGETKLLVSHVSKPVPASIPVTNEFLTFCGLYVSEGHGEPWSVQITNRHNYLQETCQQWFSSINLNSKRKDEISVNYYSALIARFMKAFGTHARNKRIPSWVFNLSDEHLGILLRAAFDGDGWVEKNGSVCYLSKSKSLISDMRYLLLRYGITTRITTKAVNRWEYYQINITGKENLLRFKNHVNFSIDYKHDRLDKIIKSANTNVDIVPDSGFIIKSIRRRFELLQKDVASIIGSKQCYVSMIENSERNISKERFQKLAEWAAAKDSQYSYLLNLKNFNFRKIKSIKAVPCVEGFVYDIAVKDTETFMAGFGGIFVHNTFMIANVIEKIQKPTLVVAHNKTLAAQLYAELKELFPHNRVEYFISYYDYYQPESYLPATDMYIEKDSSVNPQIERMRLQAVSSLMARKDVIVVASVSCIYSIGDPKDFAELSVKIKVGDHMNRDQLLRKFVGMQYERNDQVLESGNFRVRGDTIDLVPGYNDEIIYRIEFFGDDIEKITELERLNLTTKSTLDEIEIYPAKQFVATQESIDAALVTIKEELEEVLPGMPLLEKHRLEKRTKYDMEMIKELGFCSGIENYSRHFDGRKPGEPPYTLFDYFPDDFLLVIDESHQTIPQMHGMYKGDFARKKNLIEHGFRLPSAYDNRPLKFEEIERFFKHVVFVSATPAQYEKETSGQLVEAIIRPTGLVDPTVEVRPTKGQITDIIAEIKANTKKGWRTLVTTLTKKMAEDLTSHLAKEQLKVRYLHSEIETLERTEIIRELRLGEFDVLVGINLLREGLDIPEVALVCILDADKEGFLRNEQSLLQTIGRAARNSEGRVIFYADKMTVGMKLAIDKTHARRKMQLEYNEEHGIKPRTIIKAVPEKKVDIKSTKHIPKSDIPNMIIELEKQMGDAAANLDFEEAIRIRDRIKELEKELGAEVHSISED